jgi:hypothetical protein
MTNCPPDSLSTHLYLYSVVRLLIRPLASGFLSGTATAETQDTRGRFASEGAFVPHVFEARDGADTIAWAAAQPWSSGAVGTFGGSYLGSDQLLAATSPAVLLFAPCAQARFTLRQADLPAVVRICQLVQGMPLALELAAAWAEMQPLEEIAVEIARSADFQDLPARQRSMRAVFEWSWNLLSASERNVFCRLSVFRGGCTRQAAWR